MPHLLGQGVKLSIIDQIDKKIFAVVFLRPRSFNINSGMPGENYFTSGVTTRSPL